MSMQKNRKKEELVIVGSGMAGYTLIRELRKRDSKRPITLISADDGAMYSKPMLSNAFAQGKVPAQLVQKASIDAAQDLNVTIKAETRVEAIDRRAKTITLNRGNGRRERLSYATLVLAMGADPRTYRVEGDDAVPVMMVNDLGDYRRWRERIGKNSRILLIGAGLIGCEFANDLALGGHEITVLDPASWPLSRLVPQEMGALLGEALTEAGVNLHMENSAIRMEKGTGGNIAHLQDGRKVVFDHALSAIGLLPRTQLARDAGLDVATGISVDENLRTSDPHIYALGDCCETEAGVQPFVLPLMAQARALAKVLSGDDARLEMAAMPVTVKTPCLALVVCPPQPGAQGKWVLTERSGRDCAALFEGGGGVPLGFALSGSQTARRQALAKTMPALLGAG
ncbi:NAD(P)/FAD-dependent oxidoreductase [Varunaivibrio sulfuroxidans]|uniref:Rubredoxin-NAD+ reductase n=1 Tax=Varunaivibrio sulfuroxidans TaxID=1773489 RepID=A0A4R3J791_9PROT|nr:FAD-dependent oxidoreductase [Varunaivibrio sulfuroxidans]TCS61287.1 rubredoxin-NAD+ reductase [Varunaivibrio sulfuroxidans]WES31096.1 FAD-dependent oxidoreductase [Varunaivibrio sulfuroxidans]